MKYIQNHDKQIVTQAIINNGVKVTFLVLDPLSDKIPYKEHVFGVGNFGEGDLSRELKGRIDNFLQLCRKKKRKRK